MKVNQNNGVRAASVTSEAPRSDSPSSNAPAGARSRSTEGTLGALQTRTSRSSSTSRSNRAPANSNFELSSAVTYQPGSGQKPSQPNGEPYSTPHFIDPKTGEHVHLTGVELNSGVFIVTNHETHKPVASLRIMGSGDNKTAVPPEQYGLKGGTRYTLRDGTPCDSRGNPLRSYSSSPPRPRTTYPSSGLRLRDEPAGYESDDSNGSDYSGNALTGGAPSRAEIQRRTADLERRGFRPMGYHGTNQAGMNSLVQQGPRRGHGGSNSGLERGNGFYVSRQPGYAEDWADSATQSGEPEPPRYETPRYPGERGMAAVGTVHVRSPQYLTPGRDIAWGQQSSQGDPHGDRRLSHRDTHGDMADGRYATEAVIAPRQYRNTRIVPTYSSSSGRMGPYPSHEAPEYGRPFHPDDDEY